MERHWPSARSVSFLDSMPRLWPVEIAADDPALARLAMPDTGDFSQRPELAGLRERLRAAEAMVRAARGGRLPTVNAFASYQYDQGWQLDRHGDS
jgi:outer membrane protein TolC